MNQLRREMNHKKGQLLKSIGINILEKEFNESSLINISKEKTLSEEFIREFQDSVDWYNISRYQTLSEGFIREYQDRVYWNEISFEQTLSEDFLREFENRIIWETASQTQNMSDEFLIEFQKKIFWEWYFDSQDASFEIMKKFILKTNYTKLEFNYLHLNESQMQEIEKILSLKNIFTN